MHKEITLQEVAKGLRDTCVFNKACSTKGNCPFYSLQHLVPDLFPKNEKGVYLPNSCQRVKPEHWIIVLKHLVKQCK